MRARSAAVVFGRVSTPTALLRVKSPWLIGFGLVAVAQLAFVALHVSQAALITTWILAPLLAVWVWRARGPKLLVLALMFCWVGDVLGNPRKIGIGQGGLVLSVAAFAAANVCLMILFARRGALAALWRSIGGLQRWRAGIALLYLVAAIVGLWLTWSSLEPVLRVVASIYLLLLVGTATTALAVDICAGIGEGSARSWS
jgi:YhhN family